LNTSQKLNADAGTILGLEASFQQPFTALPPPFNGLGLSANLTLIDSEVSVPEREGKLPFFGQADVLYNIAPYYQKGRLETRVAWNYRGDFLESLRRSQEVDFYDRARTTVDVTATYRVGPSRLGEVSVQGQVRNLTNAAESRFEGARSRQHKHWLTGRTVVLGLLFGA
jgi:TonB-dependent receptor